MMECIFGTEQSEEESYLQTTVSFRSSDKSFALNKNFLGTMAWTRALAQRKEKLQLCTEIHVQQSRQNSLCDVRFDLRKFTINYNCFTTV